MEKCQLSCVPILTYTVWVISFTFSYSFRILNKSNASRKMKMSFRIFVVFLVFGIHSIFVWIYICRKGRHIKNDEGLIAKLIQNRTKSVKLRWKYNKSRMIWKLSNGIMLFLFVFKMKYFWNKQNFVFSVFVYRRFLLYSGCTKVKIYVMRLNTVIVDMKDVYEKFYTILNVSHDTINYWSTIIRHKLLFSFCYDEQFN